MTVDEARQMVMPFGKYARKTLGEIADADIRYIDWLQDAQVRSPQLAEAIAVLGIEYAREIDRAVFDE